MNFVIADIGAQRNTYIDMKDGDPEDIARVNGHMLTLKQYGVLARRIIGKWAPSYLRSAMLNSEDAIDFVSHHLMVADWGFKPGKSDLKTWRGYCGQRAIQSYVSALSRQNTFRDEDGDDHVILTTSFDEDDKQDPNSESPDTSMSKNEERQGVFRYVDRLMEGISKTQKDCIIMYYLYEFNMAEIGRRVGLTREGVRRSIENGMAKLRELAAQ